MIAVWFDIDGTLLDTGGSGGGAFKRALRRHYRLDDEMEYIRFAGATDLQIVGEVFSRHGYEEIPDDVQIFFDALEHEYDASFTAQPPRILHGVRELVQALSEEARVALGLLTGNAEKLAYTKLRHVDLHHYFDHGGFGDQHHCRKQLAEFALQRATDQHGPIVHKVVLGDTPRDVEAAHAVGATAIAVATGGYSEEDLRATGAHHVLADLGDREAVLQAILGV